MFQGSQLVPQKMFFTKGIGVHREKLTSFEMALRDARIARYNLVRVSSIFPPHCQIIEREEGEGLLAPGQVAVGSPTRWFVVPALAGSWRARFSLKAVLRTRPTWRPRD